MGDIVLAAVALLRSWMAASGLYPHEDFDPSDLNCVRTSGPHIIITASAQVPPDYAFDLETLRASLSAYIQAHNGAVCDGLRFQPYDVEVYPHAYGGTVLYASVYN